jgi:glyoxylase-like metal-dependent hydrolase (beta-lactamase superfamily II)
MIGSLQFAISGPMDCHVYALKCPDGIVLVDSGAGTHTEILLANIHSAFGDTKVAALIVTHGHLDHCGGAAALKEKTGCRVIASEWSCSILETGDEEASGLRVARLQGTYPPEARMVPCAVDTVVHDGASFEAGGQLFTALHVRGHSQDSCCYLTNVDGRTSMFAGDVVFYGGILGVINVDGSGMEGYRADLSKLNGLGVEGFFPGHGIFTLHGGQRHIDKAIEQMANGFMPRQIGQGDAIF